MAAAIIDVIGDAGLNLLDQHGKDRDASVLRLSSFVTSCAMSVAAAKKQVENSKICIQQRNPEENSRKDMQQRPQLQTSRKYECHGRKKGRQPFQENQFEI